MKKILITSLVVGLLITQTLGVLAATPTVFVSQIKMADLTTDGEGGPAILPTNPFYGMKNAFGRFFGGSSLTAVMGRLDDRAAEVLKARQIAPDNLALFTKTLRNYDSAAFTVFTKIKKVPAGELSADATGKNELTLDIINERLLVHAQFISDLLSVPQPVSVRPLIDEIAAYINDALLHAYEKLDKPREFYERVFALAQSRNEWYALRTAEAIQGLINRAFLSKTLDAEALNQLRFLVNDLLTIVSGALEAQIILQDQSLIAALPDVSGDPAMRLITLAVLNEQVVASDLSSALSLERTRLVEKLASASTLTAADVAVFIGLSKTVTASLEKEVLAAAGFVYGPTLQLLARAKFNSEQAIVLADEGNYAGSLLQASLALATSEMAFVLLPKTELAYEQEMTRIRGWYDSLNSRAKAFIASLPDKENAGTINRLLTDASVHIVETSSRIAARREWHAIPANLYNLKLNLAIVDALATE